MSVPEANRADIKGSPEAIYKQLGAAYNSFMFDLGNASNDAQRRVFAVATQPWAPGKDPFSAVSQAWTEVDLPKRYGHAFREYRHQIQKIVSSVDLNTLDSVALMALAQAIEYVALYGSWLADPTVIGRTGLEKPTEKAATPPAPPTPPVEPDPSRKSGRT